MIIICFPWVLYWVCWGLPPSHYVLFFLKKKSFNKILFYFYSIWLDTWIYQKNITKKKVGNFITNLEEVGEISYHEGSILLWNPQGINVIPFSPYINFIVRYVYTLLFHANQTIWHIPILKGITSYVYMK